MNGNSEHNLPQGAGRQEANARAPASETALPQKIPQKIPLKQPLPPKTGGERFYDAFQFFYGKVFIIALTATLGFMADQKHAPDNIAGLPNIVKKFQGWFHNKVFHNKIYPVAEKGDTAKLIGTGLVSTMILSHGGNFFAPAIKSLENNRENISNWYNERFGTPQDVEAAHERLKDIPKQNWADVIKGRAVAWGTMFGLVMTAYVGLGKEKESGRYWLDMYEDKFARVATGLTKTGKEIAATPIAQELTEIQKANKAYRFSRILALDIFTTTSAIVIWNMVSRMSAKHRADHEKLAAYEKADIPVPKADDMEEYVALDTPAKPSERVMAPNIEAAPAQELMAPKASSVDGEPPSKDGYVHLVTEVPQDSVQLAGV